jgi:hypothetical protein
MGKFSPTAWEGSRAAIVESNAKLLDELAQHGDPALVEFISREKIKLASLIEAEHRVQYLIERHGEERFE